MKENKPVTHQNWNDYPDLLADIDWSRNDALLFRGRAVRPTELSPSTGKWLDWRCAKCDHQWRALGSNRVAGNGCPACSNRIVHMDGRNSMASTHPELAEEYIGDANTITAGTYKKLDWRCSTCGHEWKALGSSRAKQGTGCPVCANKVIHKDGRNSMASTHPILARDYMGDATKVIAGTHRKLDLSLIHI